jgi:hypothetical protein
MYPGGYPGSYPGVPGPEHVFAGLPTDLAVHDLADTPIDLTTRYSAS